MQITLQFGLIPIIISILILLYLVWEFFREINSLLDRGDYGEVFIMLLAFSSFGYTIYVALNTLVK